MNSELHHTRHPLRIHIFWAIIYILIIALSIFGMYKVAARIRTHTLPTGQIELTIPYSKYLVDEVVTFTIKNDFNSPIYVLNNCPSEPLEVYRQENEKWVRQHDKVSIGDCPSEQRQVSIPANGVVNGSFAPWRHLFSRPGKYRVVAFVEYYNTLPYQDFEVITRPSKKPSVLVSPAPSSEQESTQPTAQKPATTQNITPYTVKQSQTITTSRGEIAVQYDTSNIYVTSITPAPGCTYEGGKSGRQIQVKFKCLGGETQIQLNIINGQLVPKIESGGG